MDDDYLIDDQTIDVDDLSENDFAKSDSDNEIMPILLTIDQLVNIQKSFLQERSSFRSTQRKVSKASGRQQSDATPTKRRTARNEFLKPWTKLSISSKISRITEYIDKLDLSDAETAEMKFKAINIIKTKTPLTVDYDYSIGQIISIQL